MAKDKAGYQRGAGETKTPPVGIASLESKLDVEISPPQTAEEFVLRAVEVENLDEVILDVEISPPQTAEEFVLRAIEIENLDEVIKILRDWYGRNEIKKSLYRLDNKDPVSRILHAHRHAVEIYAKEHGLTPAKLMGKLRGIGDGQDPGSERHKLQKAREFLKQDYNALIGANALARHWKKTCPEGRDATKHLKGISPKI